MTVTPAWAGVARDPAPTRRGAKRRPRRRRRGSLAIFGAIPPGHARAASQRQWLSQVRSHAATATLRSDAHRNLMAVSTALAAFADWDELTTRPTWALIGERSWLSRRSVARWIRWLHEAGLLATVAHGTTSDFSPGILRSEGSDTVCEAAVYVLIYPASLHPVTDDVADENPSDSSVEENGTPSWSPEGTSPARAREDARDREASQPQRSAPAWSPGQRPASTQERRQAALEAQRQVPLLRRISTAHVAALFREAHLAAWTLGDVLYALDHQPAGELTIHTTAVRHVPGWVRHRLGAWRCVPWDASTPLALSRSQIVRADQVRLQALERARAERDAADSAAATPPAEAAQWAAQARDALHAARARRSSS